MQEDTSAGTAKNLSNVLKINEYQFRDHLGKMVRSTVEETLNDMLDAEADQLCNAQRYERTEARTGGRAGHYKRKLHTTSGEVELKIPKLTFPPQTDQLWESMPPFVTKTTQAIVHKEQSNPVYR